MRHRSLATLGLLGAVVLVLGGLLIGRLMPADGGDGQVDPVIISPAGVIESGGTSTPPTNTPDATATTVPTVRPSTPAPAPAEPTQVKPKPKPVDDDDDDDPDDDPDDDADRDDD